MATVEVVVVVVVEREVVVGVRVVVTVLDDVNAVEPVDVANAVIVDVAEVVVEGIGGEASKVVDPVVDVKVEVEVIVIDVEAVAVDDVEDELATRSATHTRPPNSEADEQDEPSQHTPTLVNRPEVRNDLSQMTSEYLRYEYINHNCKNDEHILRLSSIFFKRETQYGAFLRVYFLIMSS